MGIEAEDKNFKTGSTHCLQMQKKTRIELQELFEIIVKQYQSPDSTVRSTISTYFCKRRDFEPIAVIKSKLFFFRPVLVMFNSGFSRLSWRCDQRRFILECLQDIRDKKILFMKKVKSPR